MSVYMSPLHERIVLSSFTSKEKQAFYQLLCGAMIIDGVRDPREIAVIEKAMQMVGLTDSERQESRKSTTEEQIAVMRAMDNSKKVMLGKWMAQVILADKEVAQIEDRWFNYMLNLLNIPDIDSLV